MLGESLTDHLIITDGPERLLISLMHECHKLMDKNDPNIERARRYECHLNTYDLLASESSTKTALKLFSLNEFLTIEQFHHQNILIDVRCFFDTKILLVYSKQGTGNKNNTEYEYDYDRFRFIRDIQKEKAGILVDLLTNRVVEFFPSLFKSSTNVASLITSPNGFILDNNWDMYNLKKCKTSSGSCQVYRHFGEMDLNYEFSRLVFNGEYLLAVNGVEENKILLVRCYDSFVSGSFVVGDRLTCVEVGEMDRTIVIG